MTVPQVIDITMPSLGADMAEGMLVKWEVKVGDRVDEGDIIAVLETHKGAIDMEVYHSGTIDEILVQPIATVPVGTVLAKLQTDSAMEQTPSNVVETAKPTLPSAEQQISMDKNADMGGTESRPVITPVHAENLASPIVRKIAEQQQLDLSNITGSGLNGAIILKDLGQITPSESATKQSSIALPKMRNAIAAAMIRSKKEIPHFYVSLDIDMTNAQCWLQQMNAKQDPEQRILLLVLLLKAVAAALLKFPALNGVYSDEQFHPADDIHIGNVISLRDGGLVVPAIHNVDKLSVQEVMLALRDITIRSRQGHLRTSELTDATITVTSMGERGTDSVFGVIYPPQVAIIGFGRLRKTALVKDDSLVVSDVITVCLSADHRAIDGMLAAKFLTALSNQLQKPESL